MRYEGDAKVVFKGDRAKASQLVSKARSWIGVQSNVAPKNKPFIYYRKLNNGITFKGYSNGFDVSLEIYVPVSKKSKTYFLFDPHSFQQPYQQGWGEPFFSGRGEQINYPYGSDLPTMTEDVNSFKQAVIEGNNITHEFGRQPPLIPGNCLWIDYDNLTSVSWWGNTQGTWGVGVDPAGFGPPAFFRPHELYRSYNNAQRNKHYHRMEYAKEPLPAGSTSDQNDGTWEDSWHTTKAFDENSTIWVNGSPVKVSVSSVDEGSIITGACVIGDWLVYMVGALRSDFGVIDEYVYKINLSNNDSSEQISYEHYDSPFETEGNTLYWTDNTNVAEISSDGLTWNYTRLIFLDEIQTGVANWDYSYFTLNFRLSERGDLIINKLKKKSLPKIIDYYSFGMYEGEMYYYRPETNNTIDYESYVMWFSIRWNSAIGIQTSWGDSPDYFFIKVHGHLFLYEFSDVNNINFDKPLYRGYFNPDSLGDAGGKSYDWNRVNGTFLGFDDGIIFSLSGVHFNPDQFSVLNSTKNNPQFDHRGYCFYVSPSGDVINLHKKLLDEEFDLKNGRFSTIMLSIGEVGE